MNQQRDIERLLDPGSRDGPTVAPDRVIDVVADRIERQAAATRMAPRLEAIHDEPDPQDSRRPSRRS